MINKEQQKYVIGIDGGATKTTVALADLKGNIKKIIQSGPSNAVSIGTKKATSNIIDGIKKVLIKRRDSITPISDFRISFLSAYT